MTLGSVETGSMVACTSLFTMIISKVKCYYKRPPFFCACMDSKDVELLYVSKKRTIR